MKQYLVVFEVPPSSHCLARVVRAMNDRDAAKWPKYNVAAAARTVFVKPVLEIVAEALGGK